MYLEYWIIKITTTSHTVINSFLIKHFWKVSTDEADFESIFWCLTQRIQRWTMSKLTETPRRVWTRVVYWKRRVSNFRAVSLTVVWWSRNRHCILNVCVLILSCFTPRDLNYNNLQEFPVAIKTLSKLQELWVDKHTDGQQHTETHLPDMSIMVALSLPNPVKWF